MNSGKEKMSDKWIEKTLLVLDPLKLSPCHLCLWFSCQKACAITTHCAKTPCVRQEKPQWVCTPLLSLTSQFCSVDVFVYRLSFAPAAPQIRAFVFLIPSKTKFSALFLEAMVQVFVEQITLEIKEKKQQEWNH